MTTVLFTFLRNIVQYHKHAHKTRRASQCPSCRAMVTNAVMAARIAEVK